MVTSNKPWALLLFKIFVVLIASVFSVVIITYVVLCDYASFSDTYQSVIYRKYTTLKSTESPKIIIVGGSNAGFGINTKVISEKTGYPVVNMGLHAGFGMLFNTEIAKKYIKPGDILILAYEYGLSSAAFEKLGDMKLIMSGIDNNVEMYESIPLNQMPYVVGNLFSYFEYKKTRPPLSTGIYSSDSFDDYGNMIATRESYIINDYENNVDIYKRVYGNSLLPDKSDRLKYLNDLRTFIQKRGASVYFTAASLMRTAYEGTDQQLTNYAKELEGRTGIKWISDPNDYLFDPEYMYDTIYHCNSRGEIKRSELLANDIMTSNILK